MIARKLSLPFLALSLLLLSGCSTTGSTKNTKDWGKCAMVGGAVWGIPGAAHSLATGGVSLAAGALISGLACATADNRTGSDVFPQPEADDASRVYFNFNSATLKSSNKAMLNKFLEGRHDASFTIVGHTCDIGSTEFNQGLSVRRADSVKAYLMQMGIKESKIKVRGKGESEPLYPNTSDENRMKNRRAEIMIMH